MFKFTHQKQDRHIYYYGLQYFTEVVRVSICINTVLPKMKYVQELAVIYNNRYAVCKG